MTADTLFCHLSSTTIADMIIKSQVPVCYSAPGVHKAVADAKVKA